MRRAVRRIVGPWKDAASRMTEVVPSDGRVQVPGRGPRIVLAVEGETAITTPGGRAALARGQALFIGADERVLAVDGDGVVVQADVP